MNQAVLFVVMMALQLPCLAASAVGQVTGVYDGDTMYVLINGSGVRVRLAEIDAPEKEQPFGHKAEQSLRSMVGKKMVSLTWDVIDPYGRPVVHVMADGLDVNAEQVKRGFAWAYRRYLKDQRLLAHESAAKAAQRGLWSVPGAIEPWTWRREHP